MMMKKKKKKKKKKKRKKKKKEEEEEIKMSSIETAVYNLRFSLSENYISWSHTL
jgi:hypothetical protein